MVLRLPQSVPFLNLGIEFRLGSLHFCNLHPDSGFWTRKSMLVFSNHYQKNCIGQLILFSNFNKHFYAISNPKFNVHSVNCDVSKFFNVSKIILINHLSISCFYFRKYFTFNLKRNKFP